MTGALWRLLFLGILIAIIGYFTHLPNGADQVDLRVILLLFMAAGWILVYRSGSNVINARFDFKAELNPDPKAFFGKAVRALRDNTLYQERQIDWGAWLQKQDEVSDFDKAVALLNALFQELQDKYARFMDVKAIKAYYAMQKEKGVVTSSMLRENIGYLRVKNFMSTRCAKEFDSAMRSLDKAHGIILDLRDNPGGLLTECNFVLSMLLPEGQFAELRGHREGNDFRQQFVLTKTAIVVSPKFPEDKETRYPDYLRGRPLVILMNRGTASASEIIAGILQECGVAKLVGEKSYGKGIAQRLNYLDYGTAIYCTFASVHLQSGDCVQGNGLEPDYWRSSEAQLELAWRLLAKEGGLRPSPDVAA